MRIDVWSDFTCPFCFIGKKRLENALSKFSNRDNVEVVYRSFQLNPHTKTSGRKQVSPFQLLKKNQEQIASQAKEVGLDLRFDAIIDSNTFDGHRLTHFAVSQGKGAELIDRLLRAYLSDLVDISDHNVLVSLAAKAGLDKEETAAMLKSDAYSDQVKADMEEAKRLNVTGVPFFVFNNKHTVSGDQPEHVFTEALNKTWTEEQESLQLN